MNHPIRLAVVDDELIRPKLHLHRDSSVMLVFYEIYLSAIVL